jgi:hypothetical protein
VDDHLGLLGSADASGDADAGLIRRGEGRGVGWSRVERVRPDDLGAGLDRADAQALQPVEHDLTG